MKEKKNPAAGENIKNSGGIKLLFHGRKKKFKRLNKKAEGKRRNFSHDKTEYQHKLCKWPSLRVEKFSIKQPDRDSYIRGKYSEPMRS